jgi:hypothetical protein
MSLLGDALTDRDKVEYFMSSLVKRSYLVKKINLSHSFDQACRDVIEFVSKEKIAATIIDQHAYKQHAGAKPYNLEPYDDDNDFEAPSHDNQPPRSCGQLWAEKGRLRKAKKTQCVVTRHHEKLFFFSDST